MDGMFACIFESSQLEGRYVGDLLYVHVEVFVFFKVHILHIAALYHFKADCVCTGMLVDNLLTKIQNN